MSFGMSNAPYIFMDLINRVLKLFLYSFVIGSLMIFLGYSHSRYENEKHLRVVLVTLKDCQLYAIFSKCEFSLDSVAFLGHVVSSDGIKVDPKKIEVVQSFPIPTSAMEIQSFLGLACYHHRFVEGFSPIAAPLTNLSYKGVSFRLCGECEKSFQKINTTLTTTSVLTHENSYPAHDLVFAAIAHALKIWRHYLYSVPSEVYTDHCSH
ncbi:uncharacterized mitochondrial protein AtMg00860-like [Nicotiana tomentosiformis]|uniref:uncharacterized mitochondrial protein AtMg00860-like n=1 Tax=Nicotiana tomentosiformis TaxID=4098 RepID=UPI00388C4A2C